MENNYERVLIELFQNLAISEVSPNGLKESTSSLYESEQDGTSTYADSSDSHLNENNNNQLTVFNPNRLQESSSSLYESEQDGTSTYADSSDSHLNENNNNELTVFNPNRLQENSSLLYESEQDGTSTYAHSSDGYSNEAVLEIKFVMDRPPAIREDRCIGLMETFLYTLRESQPGRSNFDGGFTQCAKGLVLYNPTSLSPIQSDPMMLANAILKNEMLRSVLINETIKNGDPNECQLILSITGTRQKETTYGTFPIGQTEVIGETYKSQEHKFQITCADETKAIEDECESQEHDIGLACAGEESAGESDPEDAIPCKRRKKI